VASGPTVADPSRFADAQGVLERYQVAVPPSVADHLERGARGLLPETPKPGDARLAEVDHRVLATVDDLAATAARLAERSGWRARVLPRLALSVEDEAARLAAAWRGLPPRGLLVAAGEATVRPVKGGEGGRAQHLALLLAQELAGEPVELLVAGSDGHDFTTGAAGAMVDGTTWRRAEAMGFAPEKRLAAFDSGPLCAQLGVAIPAFESGTNLCDLVLLARPG
jgi:hydroxypyruvate reductase